MSNAPKESKTALGDDGWYIYDGKNVSGPVNDGELNTHFRGRGDVYASKKGFSKWYRIDEIPCMFSSADNNNLDAEMLEFRKVFDHSVDTLQSLHNPPPPIKGAPKTKTIQKVGKKGSSLTIEQMMVEETIKVAQKPEPGTKPQSEEQAETKIELITDKKQLYAVIRRRLRLGNITSSLNVGFLDYFFTLSISSFFWQRRTRKELAFHIWGKQTHASASDLLVLIPLLSCYSFYSLAKLVAKAEEQNQDRKVIPWIAALLGLIPPLAICYLQDMTNRHWVLHIVNYEKNMNKT